MKGQAIQKSGAVKGQRGECVGTIWYLEGEIRQKISNYPYTGNKNQRKSENPRHRGVICAAKPKSNA